MDAFGWSTQPPATAAPSCPTDDALLAAFLGAGSFEELHSAGAGGVTVSPDAYHGGLDLPSCQSDLSLLRCQDGGVALPGHGDSSSNAFLDSVGFVPAFAGAHDGLHLHDRFAFAPEEPAQAAGSNAAFSGYSTTTGGGNVSSGDSNTYAGGGHETEVASPPCAVSGASGRAQQISQEAPPTTKRNKLPDSYPAAAVGPTATTTVESSRRWGSTNGAAAPATTSITFGQSGGRRGYEPDTEAIAQVKEMIYRAAAMRPVSSLTDPPDASPGPSSKPRRRKNVRISSDPQTVAARLRRERVSERLRALQRLVPGGSKMDTASMLDEAASYLKFLKSQLAALEALGGGGGGVSPDDDGRYSSLQRYTGRGFNLSSRASGAAGGGTMLAFGRDGVAGYVKSGRNMDMQL